MYVISKCAAGRRVKKKLFFMIRIINILVRGRNQLSILLSTQGQFPKFLIHCIWDLSIPYVDKQEWTFNWNSNETGFIKSGEPLYGNPFLLRVCFRNQVISEGAPHKQYRYMNRKIPKNPGTLIGVHLYDV